MYYDKKALLEEYGNFEGLNEDFIGKVIYHWLTTWIKQPERSKYKLLGGFWEVILPILRKYEPEKTKKYENLVGSFDYSNDEVKELFDYGDDLTNILAGLTYYNERVVGFATAEDPHYITIGEKDIAYIPNQSIDQEQHFGRETRS